MSESRLIKISKFLSKYLRHQPNDIGIKLAPGGWVAVEDTGGGQGDAAAGGDGIRIRGERGGFGVGGLEAGGGHV